MFHFEGSVRQVVHRFKYDGLTVLANPLGDLMAEYWTGSAFHADLFVPVPLHPRRVRERGYNQSALLAEAMARETTTTVDTQSLTRRRATVPQVTLDREQRTQNVAGAFRCTRDAMVGKDVLLIDDVCTTGATLEACAEALYGAGVRRVYGLTFSRANFGADSR